MNIENIPAQLKDFYSDFRFFLEGSFGKVYKALCKKN
jgi:hypothetical protein